MAEREAKRQKTEKDDDEGHKASQKDYDSYDLILRMSMQGMSTESIATVWKMEPAEVVQILEQAEAFNTKDSEGGQSQDNSQGLALLVKRLLTDPPELCCPISHALMEDPVVANDGFTYERSCVEECLKVRAKSPMTGAAIENLVLYDNKKVKSETVSFKESVVAEILCVAPQLPHHLASKVLPRAVEFVRAQLPDSTARRKLLTLLLLRVKLPGVDRDAIIQEIVSLMVEVQDDGQVLEFLRATDESELQMLLPNLKEDMIIVLYNAVKEADAKGKLLITKELACRLASRLGDDVRLNKLWDVLQLTDRYEHGDWTKASAVLLAAFIGRLNAYLPDLDFCLLNDARAYLDDQDVAAAFAKRFFNYDLGISTAVQWPPKQAARIFVDLARRLEPCEGREKQKLQLLVRAHSINASDVLMREALAHQLHSSMLHLKPASDDCGIDVEGLFLKLFLEDDMEIPADVLPNLTLQPVHLKQLSAEELMSLARQLGMPERCADGARVAVAAAGLFAMDGLEDACHNAFLDAFRLDPSNCDASRGLAQAVVTLKGKCKELAGSLQQVAADTLDLKGAVRELTNKCYAPEGKCQAFTGMSFVWDLTVYDFSNFAKDQRQMSDKFQIYPGINAWISLYPKGDSLSSPGEAALYAFVESPVHLKVRFQCRTVNRMLDHDFATTLTAKGNTTGRGYWNFIEASQLDGASIRIDILSVRLPAASLRIVAPGFNDMG
ncbi:unnamed protein product [Effrenium voratum]|uniref:U-box domain-containing protein n=1 Tax=Effrenium voratum TaxID=2562239 RepID=A0AA36NCP0_9DINO|nr:unnamed protein product [Effrenium voratum]